MRWLGFWRRIVAAIRLAALLPIRQVPLHVDAAQPSGPPQSTDWWMNPCEDVDALARPYRPYRKARL